VQCEAVFNKHPKVHRTALVGVAQRAVLCVEVDKAVLSFEREQIRKDLLAIAMENELTTDIQTMLFHRSFPVDIRHNAKILREKLSIWAAGRLQFKHVS
jgi:hypothetical protein